MKIKHENEYWRIFRFVSPFTKTSGKYCKKRNETKDLLHCVTGECYKIMQLYSDNGKDTGGQWCQVGD